MCIRDSGLSGRPDEPLQFETDRGTVTAERAALCTNVFPSLLKRYSFHTVPVYDYVLMTEPLSDEQLASIGWSGREGLADMANQFHYSRLTKDNRIPVSYTHLVISQEELESIAADYKLAAGFHPESLGARSSLNA